LGGGRGGVTPDNRRIAHILLDVWGVGKGGKTARFFVLRVLLRTYASKRKNVVAEEGTGSDFTVQQERSENNRERRAVDLYRRFSPKKKKNSSSFPMRKD